MNIFKNLATFDLWLIENVFEKISKWSQITLGISALGIARLFLILSVMTMLMRISLYWSPNFLPKLKAIFNTNAFEVVFLGIGVLYAIKIFSDIQRSEKIMAGGESKFANPLKHDFFIKIFRIVIIVLEFLTVQFTVEFIWLSISEPFPQSVIGVFLSCSSTIILFFLYFLSCDIFPPHKSKVREWLESFGKTLQPVPVKVRS